MRCAKSRRQTDGRTDGRTDGETERRGGEGKGWMDGWMGRQEKQGAKPSQSHGASTYHFARKIRYRKLIMARKRRDLLVVDWEGRIIV